MISGDVLRGYNDTIILSILLCKDSYGYEISKEIFEKSKGAYSIKETTLYSAFNRLQSGGYVTSYFGSESFGKRRTYFSITNLGRQYYKEKCAEWQMSRDMIDSFISEVYEYEQNK